MTVRAITWCTTLPLGALHQLAPRAAGVTCRPHAIHLLTKTPSAETCVLRNKICVCLLDNVKHASWMTHKRCLVFKWHVCVVATVSSCGGKSAVVATRMVSVAYHARGLTGCCVLLNAAGAPPTTPLCSGCCTLLSAMSAMTCAVLLCCAWALC